MMFRSWRQLLERTKDDSSAIMWRNSVKLCLDKGEILLQFLFIYPCNQSIEHKGVYEVHHLAALALSVASTASPDIVSSGRFGFSSLLVTVCTF